MCTRRKSVTEQQKQFLNYSIIIIVHAFNVILYSGKLWQALNLVKGLSVGIGDLNS